MTFPATDVRLRDILLRFFTIGRSLHAALKDGRDRPANFRVQAQILAGVGARDAGDRAGLA